MRWRDLESRLALSKFILLSQIGIVANVPSVSRAVMKKLSYCVLAEAGCVVYYFRIFGRSSAESLRTRNSVHDDVSYPCIYYNTEVNFTAGLKRTIVKQARRGPGRKYTCIFKPWGSFSTFSASMQHDSMPKAEHMPMASPKRGG